MICRWDQDFLGYQFSVIHRNTRMMAGVDALTRQFGPLIRIHYFIADIINRRDMDLQPLAYQARIFHLSAIAKLSAPNMATPYTPIITLLFTTGTISTIFVPTTSA